MNLTQPTSVTLDDRGMPLADRTLVIDKLLIPLLLVPDVPVVLRDIREPLSTFQTFLLRAAAEHELLSLDDLFDASRIPLAALRQLCEQFREAGLFTRSETLVETYTVNVEQCRDTLEKGRLELRKPGSLHLVYLPQTDELIAYRADVLEGFVREFRFYQDSAGFPVPNMSGRNIGQFIRQRIVEGGLLNRPDELIELSESEMAAPAAASALPHPFPASIPAFVVGAEAVRGPDRHELQLRFEPQGNRKRAFALDVSSAARLWETLRDLTTHPLEPKAAAPLAAALGLKVGHGLTINLRGPVHATSVLGSREAERVAAQRWLTDPLPIRISRPSAGLVSRARLELQPGDPTAERLFDIDRATRRVLADNGQVTRRQVAELGYQGVGYDDVLERLWKRREIGCGQSLRSQEDLLYV